MPERIQLSRRKGWRKPENTVVVSRPSKWGNPFTIGSFKQVRGARQEFSVSVMGGIRSYIQSQHHARQIATDEFRKWLALPRPLNVYNHHWQMIDRHAFIVENLGELRGKNLACWCPLVDADGNPVPCHADVLLEIANQEQSVHIGPDCRDGKHPACDGRAWDNETDQPADCGCTCHGEGTGHG